MLVVLRWASFVGNPFPFCLLLTTTILHHNRDNTHNHVAVGFPYTPLVSSTHSIVPSVSFHLQALYIQCYSLSHIFVLVLLFLLVGCEGCHRELAYYFLFFTPATFHPDLHEGGGN